MSKFGKPNYQPMTEANFVALAKKRYAELQALNKIDNFYDYEKEFESLLFIDPFFKYHLICKNRACKLMQVFTNMIII